MSTFERIKKLAHEHGYSLNSLNNAAGLGARSIYRWNKMRPTDENLKKVAKILDVSLEYLRTGNKPQDLKTTDNLEKDLLKSYRKIAKKLTPGERKILLKNMNDTAEKTGMMIEDVRKRESKSPKTVLLTQEEKYQRQQLGKDKKDWLEKNKKVNCIPGNVSLSNSKTNSKENAELSFKHFSWYGHQIPNDMTKEIRNYVTYLIYKREKKISKEIAKIQKANIRNEKSQHSSLFDNDKKK